MKILALFISFTSLTSVLAGQWIVARDSTVRDWQEILGETSVHTFGPGGRFALVNSSKPPAHNRGIRYVQPNLEYQTLEEDPQFSNSWGLLNTGQSIPQLGMGIPGFDIGAVDAWRAFSPKSDITVAVLDTGSDLSHEDLQHNLWTDSETGARGWNALSPTTPPQDDYHHGTFCAGIIGAEARNPFGSRGIFPNARLMAVKHLDSLGFGTTENAITAIQYAVDKGARILNLSWGGTHYDRALYDTLEWAAEKGVLLVAAAGNSSYNNDLGISAIYPASFKLPNLISVAAYNSRRELAPFSNYGKRSVHLGAPGVGIFSTTLGGYSFGDGTSYAAPFVTGVAAILWSNLPTLSAAEVKDRLIRTTLPLHYYEKEHTLAGGIVHAAHALADDRPPHPSQPSHWEVFPYALATPHPYKNNVPLHFDISHPGARFIRVHFTRLVTEPSYDKVTLRDKDDTVILTYDGQVGELLSADAIGETLKIEFLPDSSESEYGFEIDRYEVGS